MRHIQYLKCLRILGYKFAYKNHDKYHWSDASIQYQFEKYNWIQYNSLVRTIWLGFIVQYTIWYNTIVQNR